MSARWNRLGGRVVAALLVLRRQQEAQVVKAHGIGRIADALLERRHDVDAARLPSPLVVPALDLFDRIETADRIRRLLTDLRDVLLMEESMQNVSSLRIDSCPIL